MGNEKPRCNPESTRLGAEHFPYFILSLLSSFKEMHVKRNDLVFDCGPSRVDDGYAKVHTLSLW